VLFNGRRMVQAPYGIGETAQSFVDTNLIPPSAIGRIEVLKDGAAATYGSDAIAGVVNFITKRGFNGLEIGGDYSHIDGSDGDYTANVAWGWTTDKVELFLAGGVQHRSELSTRERDWAIRPFAVNPQGGYSSISNPGRFIALGGPSAGTSFNDPGCVPLGGTLPTGGTCQFQYGKFDNLVEEENRFQVFGSLNIELTPTLNFFAEALYGYTDVPEWKTSPSYPPQSLTSQVVPATHPGLINMVAQNPSLSPLLAGGALFIGRTFGEGGLPPNGTPQVGSRNYNALRIAAGFNGDLGENMSWDFGVTFMEDVGERSTNDTYIVRLNSALQGLGGPNCTGTTPGANGCEYYNPFSNAIPRGAFGGAPNPQYVPSLANSAALVDWLTDPSYTEATTQLTTVDFVLSGASGLELPGGNVGWAVGAQARFDSYELDPSDVTDLSVFPCQRPGQTVCANRTGPFAFLAGTFPADLSRDVTALFGELSVPVFETLDVQLAVRYEDYGGKVGSTVDPKVAVKWQALPVLALRGSAQTTFRGPTLNQLGGQFTTLQFVAPTSAFKAIDTFGNPGLAPESAFTYNLGLLLDAGGFKASIDYWSYDFEDPVTVEPFDAILANVLATGCTNALASRVTFSSGCTGANVQRVSVNIINGPKVKTSGVDVGADYTIDGVLGGEITFGGGATYLEKYEVGELRISGILIAPKADLAGLLNRGTGYRSMPQLKGELFANLNTGDHNLRFVSRYTDDYFDQRAAITGNGKTIDSVWVHDLHYVWDTPWGSQLNASVVNIADEDPPFARLDLNYDPYTGLPLGRVFKVGVSHKFGG
jgi:outer membrane receptor protein involved in Fe transport